MKKKNPCKWNCEDRQQACHNTCDKYIAYKKSLEPTKKALEDKLYDRYLKEVGGGIWRMRRSKA